MKNLNATHYVVRTNPRTGKPQEYEEPVDIVTRETKHSSDGSPIIYETTIHRQFSRNPPLTGIRLRIPGTNTYAIESSITVRRVQSVAANKKRSHTLKVLNWEKNNPGLICPFKTASPRPSVSKETRLKMSLARKGIKLSDETKHKMSLAKLGKPRSEFTKYKISASRKGKPLSQETKRKISETLRHNWSNPDYRRTEFISRTASDEQFEEVVLDEI